MVNIALSKSAAPGSSPGPSANSPGVAKCVRRLAATQLIGGSIPPTRSRRARMFQGRRLILARSVRSVRFRPGPPAIVGV